MGKKKISLPDKLDGLGEGPPGPEALRVRRFGLAAPLTIPALVLLFWVKMDPILLGLCWSMLVLSGGLGMAAFYYGKMELAAIDRGRAPVSGRDMTRWGVRLGIGSTGAGVLLLLVGGVMAMFGGGYERGEGGFSTPKGTFELWEEALEDDKPSLYAFCFRSGMYRPKNADLKGGESPEAFHAAFAEEMTAYRKLQAALSDLQRKQLALRKELKKKRREIAAIADSIMRTKLAELAATVSKSDNPDRLKAWVAQETKKFQTVKKMAIYNGERAFDARTRTQVKRMKIRVDEAGRKLEGSPLPGYVRNLVRDFEKWRKLMKEQDFSGPSWKQGKTSKVAAARIKGKRSAWTVLLIYVKVEDGWKIKSIGS